MTTPFDSLAMTRRLILKGVGFLALAGLGIVFFRPGSALAAASDKYPDDAFRQKDSSEAIKLLYGRTAEPSDKIKLDAPEIAENGAVVPVSVTTTLAGVTSISFFASENPNALAASYAIPPGTLPAVANRLKLAKTCRVIAIVESSGKLFSATKDVKVTVGG